MTSLKWLGVIIPGVIILFVMFIGVIDIGITEEIILPGSINFNTLFPHEETSDNCYTGFTRNEENYITLKTVKIKNDFFISRIKEMPYYLACYYPSVEYTRANTYYYVNGESWSRNRGTLAFNGRAFEIPPRTITTIEIKTNPSCTTKYEEIDDERVRVFVEPDNDYTEILLIEYDKTNYLNCASLTEEQIANAIRIPIE